MQKTIFLFLFFSVSLFASTLYLAYSSNIGRLNPLLATDSASSEIAGWLFDAPFKYDKNGKIVPQLASGYRFINPTTLEITLKKNLTWFDGTPVDAYDAAFTYEFVNSPNVFTPYADAYREIKEVRALNKSTFIVIYRHPYFKALEAWLNPLLPRHILASQKNPMESTFNFSPTGDGAYKLVKMENGGNITFEANSAYHEGMPKIHKIVYRFLPDASSEFMMLKTGKLDIGSLTPLQLKMQTDAAFLRSYRIVESPGNTYTYLGFNLKNKKFADIRVRKAVSMAIDRQELVDLLFLGHAQICTGPFLPGSYAFNRTVKTPKRDIKEIKKLLLQAGYTTSHPLTFEIATNSNNQLRMLSAEIIQKQLGSVGIVVKIRAMEWQAFLNTVVTPRRFETVLLGWSMPISPDAFSLWHSSQIDKKAGFNLVSYRNKTVDSLIEQAERTIDSKKVAALYQEMFARITADVPYAFLYVPNSITAVNRKISPIEPTLIGIMHNQIKWEKAE